MFVDPLALVVAIGGGGGEVDKAGDLLAASSLKDLMDGLNVASDALMGRLIVRKESGDGVEDGDVGTHGVGEGREVVADAPFDGGGAVSAQYIGGVGVSGGGGDGEVGMGVGHEPDEFQGTVAGAEDE